MSKRCDLTGIGAQTGHKVSHSNHKTKRRFVPNLQNISFLSAVLDKKISLCVTPATLRTVDHNGGLDNYLLGTSNLKLTEIAKKLKRKIKKAFLTKEKETSAPAETKAKETASKKPAKAKRPKKKTQAEKIAKKAENKIVKKKVAKKSATSTKTKETTAKKKAQ